MADTVNVNFKQGNKTTTLKVEIGTKFSIDNKEYIINEQGKPIDFKTQKEVKDIETSEHGLYEILARSSMSNEDGKNVLSSKDMEPSKPKMKEKEIVLKKGDTLMSLAEKYHVSVNDIKSKNPKLEENSLKEGNAIKMPYIPDDIYEQYEKELKEYEDKYYSRLEMIEIADFANHPNKKTKKLRKASIKNMTNENIKKTKEYQSLLNEMEMEELADAARRTPERTRLRRQESINKLKERIEIAKKQNYAKNYDFNIDEETGTVLVTLKKGMTLEDISSNFRTSDDYLSKKNPNIKDIKTDEKIPAGVTLKLSLSGFNPSQGFIKDLFD